MFRPVPTRSERGASAISPPSPHSRLRQMEVASVNLSMNESATALDAVLITGAVGDTRRRVIGNRGLDSQRLRRHRQVFWSANPLPRVLQSKSSRSHAHAGVGRGRHINQLPLARCWLALREQQPTIYVDGVRVNSRGQGNYTVFGQTSSSLDAMNPNDIESFEVIKGPAAAISTGKRRRRDTGSG